MQYSNEAFALMLLSLALSPDREEYAHPLSVTELRNLRERVRECGLVRLDSLIDMDISGLMIHLDIGEDEAYRLYTLLHRDVQLGYTIEKLLEKGIEIVTSCNAEYPRQLTNRALFDAPSVYYRCGNGALVNKPLLAIVGMGGVRTTSENKASIEALVGEGIAAGYTLLTCGEPGVSRFVCDAVRRYKGELVEFVAGNLKEHIHEEGISSLLSENRAAVLSVEHPSALYTVSHAFNRNKMLFSIAEACFVFNTDGRRGEAECIRSRLCKWVYAKSDFPGNDILISRGAIPFKSVAPEDFAELSRHWAGSRAEQLNMFDIFSGL